MRTTIAHRPPLKKGIALFCFLLLSSLWGYGGVCAPSFGCDSLRQEALRTGSAVFSCYLSYPIGSSVVDDGFGNNPVALEDLHAFLRAALGDTLLVVRGISMDGYCSPDGSAQLNDHIARWRVYRLYDYLRAGVPAFRLHPVEVRSHGADWATLRRLLASSYYPWREESLRIIDSHEPTERKKLWLAELGNGDAHRVLYDLYPLLRRVEIRVNYDVLRTLQKLKLSAPLPSLPDPLSDSAVRPSFVAPQEHAYCDTLIYVIEKPAAYTKRRHPGKVKPAAVSVVKPWFALKTNLLFDAALAANVELEVPLGNRWSVLGEYTFPWWLHPEDDWCVEMLQFGVEGRYWLGDRESLKNGRKRNLLTGWFTGVYAGGGYYDFQFNRDSGYQGEFYIAAGVSGGYSLRLSTRLNLEFSLGVGVLTTRYREYDVARGSQGNELIRQSYGTLFWIGPTKAKVSLVWLLGNKKGGKR